MAYNHLYFDTLGIEHGFLLIHTFDQLSDYIAITNYHEPPLIKVTRKDGEKASAIVKFYPPK